MIRVGHVRELPPGTMAEVLVGSSPVLVCNTGSRITAVDGRCPHLGASLGHGALHNSVVVCPWHGWEFDCVTGKGEFADLATFDIVVEHDEIFVNA